VLPTIIVVFVVMFGTIASCVGLGFSYFKNKQKQQIRSMLRNAEATAAEQRNPELLRPAQTEDILGRMLRKFKFAEKLNLMLDQAGSASTAGKLVGTCLITGLAAGLAAAKFHLTVPVLIAVPAAVCLGLPVPFLLLLQKRSKNIAAFEEQFPEGLDFLSRSMRSGHGFSVALEMLGTESPDPLGRSFRRVANDVALGSSLDVAVTKLLTLVPLVDVRFFVSSVILQQETGGNLGEILTKLAFIIRERFRLKGTVKAVSAHGRITGMVLLLMPVGVTIFMLLSNPQYLTGMFEQPLGREMIYGAIGGQILGYFVIKKIINIKV
jgi:tight adherence protein B